MPIYAYQCQACQHELEALQKISDPPLQECPQCHKKALKKQVTAAAFRLSGSGWYETDFKNGDKKNLKQKDDQDSAGKADGSRADKNKKDSKDSKTESGNNTGKKENGSTATTKKEASNTTKKPAPQGDK